MTTLFFLTYLIITFFISEISYRLKSNADEVADIKWRKFVNDIKFKCHQCELKELRNKMKNISK